MSIIQIDNKRVGRVSSSNRLSWQKKFKLNLYQMNYENNIRNRVQVTPLLQDQQNQAGSAIISLINEGRTRNISTYQQGKQFYDPQTIQNCYSPYSVFVPLQDQSYLNDEAINTFPYMAHLKDSSKRYQLDKYYTDIHIYFQQSKKKGKQHVQQQWMKVKLQYLPSIDSVKAVSILLEILKKNSNKIQELYKKYGNQCKKDIFFYRISKTSMYLRQIHGMHKNLSISVELKQKINQKTLPMVMKTWYCTLCLQYDCQKHKLQFKVSQYDYQYISQKHKIPDLEHIQSIVKLLKFYEKLKNQNAMEQQKIAEDGQDIDKSCGPKCYLKIKKFQILRLNMKRDKLISPLAKSLLKMGLEMFSYNPCYISRLFQSKYSNQNNSIDCNLIFIHFTQQCSLEELIHQKMQTNEKQLLLRQDNKLVNMVKIPVNPMKIKKATYMQKRSQNQNPQFSTCMHNFIGVGSVDIKCESCVCRDRGFCLPTCLCTQYCQIKRVGCNCKGQDSCQAEKCLCFINKLECQPGVCGECFPTKHHLKKNNCRNDQVLRGIVKKVHIGVSQIAGAGLGAFAGQNLNKNDLICKYSGQHINSDIDFIRQTMIKDLSFYNFDSPNGKVTNASIDARFMGNKARFINHGNEGESNLKAQAFYSNGTEYIALFAARQIQQGEELRFNYDGNGNLYTHHRDKYPFIKPSNLNKKN